ncbi:MAG: ABC transporter substrate-binding protein [Clostridiales bacterium]|nr:ABC transporter substrate-binding protein [Clostridiales bacterium]
MTGSWPRRIPSLALLLLLLCTVCFAGGCENRSGISESTDRQSDRQSIRIGRVVPLTGSLSNFGEGSPWVEQQAIDAVNDSGGIYIKEFGRKLKLELIYIDSESSPTKASEAANRLIRDEKVDIIIASHTNDTVNPVSAAAEQNKIPCVTIDAPGNAWLEGGPYTWSFHSFWLTDSEVGAFFDAFDLQSTNKKIGLLAPNDTEGISFAKVINEKAASRGYTIVDPGRFPVGTVDYAQIIDTFKRENIDVVCGVMISKDFTKAYQQMHEQAFVPKMACVAKAILFPASVEALGDELPLGLMTEVWWSPGHPYKSSITGKSSAEFAAEYVAATGKQPTNPLGCKHANIEIVADALKRAQTLDREVLRHALAETDLDTIIGHIKYNEQNFCETRIVVGQWQKGSDYPWEAKIISNKSAPEIPLDNASMIFPLPGATGED